jgi:molybdate transport system ATP-binding protein
MTGAQDDRFAFDLEHRFAKGASIRAALDEALPSTSVTVLFGPSGAGKTTVLRCLAGLLRPDAGVIRYGAEVWFDAARALWVSPQRRGVGLLTQDYSLFPHLRVDENLGYGLAALPRDLRRQRVREIARWLGLEPLLARRPGQLSGGQRQRVALGRALAPRPRLLLLDEPLSAVDAPTRDALRVELRELLREANVPSLLVTHDRTEALVLGDRLAVMVDGVLCQVGAVAEVFSAPATLAVARVVGTENVAPARVVERRDGLAVVAIGSARLIAVDPGGLDDEAYACLRAEEVVLEASVHADTSASNQLPGRVLTLTDEGALTRVRLDCGLPLVALVTRHSAQRLGLAPGASVTALIKAPSIRLVPRAGPAAVRAARAGETSEARRARP